MPKSVGTSLGLPGIQPQEIGPLANSRFEIFVAHGCLSFALQYLKNDLSQAFNVENECHCAEAGGPENELSKYGRPL
jgi:hypothetical protein